jgi:hypothetical protein
MLTCPATRRSVTLHAITGPARVRDLGSVLLKSKSNREHLCDPQSIHHLPFVSS